MTSSEDYYSLEVNNYPTDLPSFSEDVTPCKPGSPSEFNQILMLVAFVVVFTLDMLGNGLVIYVLKRRVHVWHLSDHYLFQLAISDILLGLTLPFWTTQFVYGWVFGLVPCKLLGALFTINMYSSIFFLTCIGLNRYISIVHAVELHGKQKPIHTIFICVFVWVTSFLLSWQELFFRDVSYIKHIKNFVCYYNFKPDQADTWRITLRLVNLSVGFLLPLGLMSFFYSKIFCTLRQSKINQSRRPQVVIVVLLLLFVFCWAPYNTLLLIDSLQRLGYIKRDCHFEKMLDMGVFITENLGLAHVCVNPFVYAFVGVKFRKEIYKFFKKSSEHVAHSGLLSSKEGTVMSVEQNLSFSRVM
ncbi:C-X-C chemokine receptor type 3-2-like [Pelobates fuscus]|uniref:C-X-C chemokine receptor type 3-2-like n=1 Tax=Pelobates fuscus TaxID=191477 RepID=UPI002FE46D78